MPSNIFICYLTDLLRQIKRLLLFGGDLALFYLVLLLVLLLRYPREFDAALWNHHVGPFTAIFAIWMVIFYIAGLYDPRIAKNGIEFYTLILRTILINAGLAVLYFYIFSSRTFSIKPQVVFVGYLALFTLLFLLWRRAYNHLTQSQRFMRNVLFIGTGEDMLRLMEELRRKPQYGYHVAGHLPVGASGPLEQTFAQVNLKQLLAEKRIGVVVTSPELHHAPQIVNQFYQNLFLGISYFDLPRFYEKLTGRVPVATIGQLWFLENITENEKKFYELSKRVAELFFTVLFGFIGLLLTPLIALAIKLDSPGPVLFRQTRIGRGGKSFLAMKFRTMRLGSEQSGPQWTKADDPRITRVGRLLRKTKLDEIPQLINILRGEMSFIGPRPEQPEFVQRLVQKIPYYNERHLIKPGLTGWAQVNAPFTSASAEDTLTKLQYDLYYIKNRSLLLDLGIILKTINIILTRQSR